MRNALRPTGTSYVISSTKTFLDGYMKHMTQVAAYVYRTLLWHHL